jgi:hypothetical protein
MNGELYNRDAEHLKLLSIFHYVMGGIQAFFGCFGFLYVIMGLIFTVAPMPAGQGNPPPKFMGVFFGIFGAGLVLIAWTIAGLVFYAGRSLALRKRHAFCMVIAALQCLWIPFGTVLGVFTLIVLMRPSVQALFQPGPPVR